MAVNPACRPNDLPYDPIADHPNRQHGNVVGHDFKGFWKS